MYILNKTGPKTDLCGTPCSNSDQQSSIFAFVACLTIPSS